MEILGENERVRIEALLTEAGLPIEVPDPDVDKLLKAMEHDKKIIGGRIRFILPSSIGEVFITDEVSTSLIEQVLVK